MFEFLKTKVSPIGLDISSHSIRMLQLQQQSGGISVLSADEIQLEPVGSKDEEAARGAVVSAIKEMLARGRFSGEEVVSCLPSTKLLIKSMRIDAFEDAKIDELLQSGALDRTGLKADTHEIRYFSAGSVKQGEEVKNEIIVFAIDKEALRKHIEMLEEAGLVPVAIDTIPCALFRSLQRSLRRGADQEKTNVFVDVGDSHTTMIIGKAGEIIFAKQIDVASEQINKQIASRLGIGVDEAVHLRSKLRSEAEMMDIEPATRQIVVDSMYSVVDELAREISLCFRYYSVTFRGQRPSQVVFAGGETYEQTLMNALKRHLGIDIIVTEPLRGFDVSGVDFPGDKSAMLCEWAVATGLCLKGFYEVEKAVSNARD